MIQVFLCGSQVGGGNLHDIGILDQLQEDVSSFLMSQVERNGSLVSVNGSEVVGHRAVFGLP